MGSGTDSVTFVDNIWSIATASLYYSIETCFCFLFWIAACEQLFVKYWFIVLVVVMNLS